ncbi:MAG: hypothetical protein AAF654_11425 [Myxococcota bacterium]
MSRCVAVVVARLGSTRLPGKVLKRAGGVPLIGFPVGAAQASGAFDEVIVATTERSPDDEIEAWCLRHNLRCFRGSEMDVALRLIEAGRFSDADAICRLNADSPFLSAQLFAAGVERFKLGAFDLVTNLWPKTFPYGVSLEVLKVDALAAVYSSMKQSEREHAYVYSYVENLHWSYVGNDHGDQSQIRMTVDTDEDWKHFSSYLDTHYPTSLDLGGLDFRLAIQRGYGKYA